MSQARRRFTSFIVAATLLLAALLPFGRPALAAPGCRFVLGFATLHSLIPGIAGGCVDNEHFNPANGDSLQTTANGLLVWRKADNHTAFTNGYRTWVNGPFGLETRLNMQRFPWEPNPDQLPVVPDSELHPPQPDLRAVQFVDSQRGWTAGAHIILGTTDGGTNWSQQYGGPDVIEQLDFLNASAGFALGQQELLQTTDGGLHWQPAGEPPQPLNQIHFLNPASGYGVAGGQLYKTTDAGMTWQPLATPISVGGLCFVSQDTGWVVNHGLFLNQGQPAPTAPAPTAMFGTTNGGQTWRQEPLPDAITRFKGLTQRLQCAQPGALWDLVIGQPGAGNEFYALYHSPDGGQGWQLVTGNEISGGVSRPPGPYAGGLSVVSASSAYLSGTCGACYPPSPPGPPAVAVGGTTDAGRTWQNVPVPGLPPERNAIAFVTTQQGWLVTFGDTTHPPEILTTHNGGRSWTRQLSVD